MQTPQWSPLLRDYGGEKLKIASPRIRDSSGQMEHPLLPAPPKPLRPVVAEVKAAPVATRRGSVMGRKVSSVSMTSVSTFDPLAGGVDPLASSSDPLADPLSSMSIGSNVSADPLSMAASQSSIRQKDDSSRKLDEELLRSKLNTSWQTQKKNILANFSMTGNISIGASNFNEFSGSGVEEGTSFRAIDKHTARLASLERAKHVERGEEVTLSQNEYENHVKKLSDDLDQAWARDERVASLKLAIQVAKLLADTTVPRFYPTVFVLVTDVLERFGNMVFKRLVARAEECLNEDNKSAIKKLTLPENFTSSAVPIGAKETCRNWFYKIACIRELLPRFLVETALLKCYRFICDDEIPMILNRLATVARGLGDPLVALYARTTLCLFGTEAGSGKQFITNMVADQLFSFQMLTTEFHNANLKGWGLSQAEYLYLMTPGLDWLMKAIAKNATKEVFQSILHGYRDNCNNAMGLNAIIEAFDASYYSHAALGMVTLIKAATQSSSTTVDLFATFGKQLTVYPPPEEQKIPLLNEVWRVVSKCDDIIAYIMCCSVWLEMTYRHYTEQEVMILLGDLTPRFEIKMPEIPDKVLRQFENAILTLISGPNISLRNVVLQSDHLLKILDVFKGTRKLELSKEILVQFKSNWKTSDAALINTVFEIGRTLHDAIDSLSPLGEKKQTAALLNGFIEKIDFGRDLEQQLNSYVECRSIFCNFDDIRDRLITCVCSLAVRACKFMKGKHNKKTAAFTKACLAYYHITIPSIADVRRKLELLLLCSQVALLNQCLPQTDAFLKSAISLIPEVPATEELDGKRMHTEERLAAFVKSLLSTLVVVPGHPEHGPFYIVQGLFNALPRYPWQPHTGVQTKVYTDMLALLCSFGQKKFIYRIPYVESNDSLYGGADEYNLELKRNINTCVEEIIKQLTVMGERTDATAKLNQARMIFDLVNQLVARMEPSQEVCVFIVRLLDLASKAKSTYTRADQKYFANTVDFARQKPEFAELFDKSPLVTK